METTLAARVERALEPLAIENGFELVLVETAGGHHAPIVRVFLDREGGIDVDALAEANTWISEVLDGVDPLPGAYTLEVSSPGIDRPLRKTADFERFAGSRAHVKTTRPLEGRSSFTGTILRVEDDILLLDCDGTECRVPLDALRKANLKADIDFGDKGAPR